MLKNSILKKNNFVFIMNYYVIMTKKEFSLLNTYEMLSRYMMHRWYTDIHPVQPIRVDPHLLENIGARPYIIIL